MASHNILFIENGRGLGGSTVSLSNLVAHLDRRAVRPFVVFSRDDQRDYFLRYADDIPTVVIPFRRTLRLTATLRKVLAPLAHVPILWRGALSILGLLDELLCTVPYVFRLKAVAQAHAVQCIHQNNGFDLSAILLARLLRLPIVIYQRGDEWDSPAVRLFSRIVDQFVANSEATRRNLLSLGIDPARITVIYPPVDFALFDPGTDCGAQRREFQVTPSQPCFGIVGALVPRKGHPVFLRAAARVLRALPTARAFVIGEAAERDIGHKNDLLALARTLDLEDRVVFTGFRSDVRELMQLLDVVVHASVQPEPFGRVIVEAMAMKKPVIAAMAGGPLEIISNHRNGILVPPGDDEQLAGAILQLLSDPARAAELATQGHRDARARFSVSAHVHAMQKLYERLLGGDRSRPTPSPHPEGRHADA